jgi:glutamine cyclotransferase
MKAALIFILLLASAGNLWAAPTYEAKILNQFDHDPTNYTQGFFFDGDVLYESTGLYGSSKVLKYTLDGQILAQTKLNDTVFGEGAVLAQGSIYVLTWKEGLVYVLDPKDLKQTKTLSLPRENWGLTYDGQKLFRSDGSNLLFRHNLNMSPYGSPVEVKDGQTPVKLLNELEYDPKTGLILANIFGQTKIAFIDPVTGQVQYYLEAKSLAAVSPRHPEGVLNGIAINGSGSLFLTGKLWPKIFQVAWPSGENGDQ